MVLAPKVVICGDGAIGKTCLLTALMKPEDLFDADAQYQPTASNNHRLDVEADHESGQVEISFDLWDTAGQEALKTLRLLAYPQTNILMIGFDMNKKESLKNIRDMWIPEFNESTESLADEPPFAIVLVGCKYDLHRLDDPDKAPDADETTEAEIEEVREKIGAVCTVMTSAQNGYGISKYADEHCKYKSRYDAYEQNSLLNVLISITLQNYLDPDSVDVESKPKSTDQQKSKPAAATPPPEKPKSEPKQPEESGCCVIA